MRFNTRQSCRISRFCFKKPDPAPDRLSRRHGIKIWCYRASAFADRHAVSRPGQSGDRPRAIMAPQTDMFSYLRELSDRR